MKVLLIEDNVSLTHWLSRLLKEDRFVSTPHRNGEAADQLLRTQQYDVVLLDLQIPRLSGKHVLRRYAPKQRARPDRDRERLGRRKGGMPGPPFSFSRIRSWL